MKKRLLLCIFILVAVFFCVGVASAAETVVFVADSGSDANSGTSADAPLQTLEAAYARLGTEGGTVVVCGKLTVAGDALYLPHNGGWVTLTSQWNGTDYAGTLALAGYTYLGGNTKLCDLHLLDESPFYFNYILCQGHSFTVGEGVRCTDSYGLSFTIFGGTLVDDSFSTASASFYDYTVTVNSGRWYSVYGGNKRVDSTAAAMGATGDVRVVINGGTFLANAENQSYAMLTPSGMNAQDGDYSLEINGGSFSCPVYALQNPGENSTRYTAYYEGDVSVVINGGTFGGTVISTVQSEEVSWVGGNYSLAIYGGDFTALKSISAPRVDGKAVCKVTEQVAGKVTVSDFDSTSGDFPEKTEVPPVYATEGVVFVGGRGEGDGSSSRTPMASLAAAVKSLGESGGTVVVVAPLRVDTASLAAYDSLTVTSVYGGVDFQAAGAKIELVNHITLGGDTEFCNITLESRGLTSMIFCAGYKAVFGEGICGLRHMDGGITEYISIYGGDRLQSNAVAGIGMAASDITVQSGDFEHVVLGNFRVHGGKNTLRTTSGENRLSITGGCFHGSIKAVGMNHHAGDARVHITGGKFLCSLYGIATPVNVDADCNTVNGNVSIDIDGGEYHGGIFAAERTDRTYFNGKFTLTMHDSDLRCIGEIRGCADVWGDNSSTVESDCDFLAQCVGTSTFQNPTVNVGADPSVCYHDGWYYYVKATQVGGEQAIAISRSPNLADIESAKFVNVYVTDAQTEARSVWAPQLKNFDGKWYLYFTGAVTEDSLRLPYAMEALGETPFDGFTEPKVFENLDPNIHSWLSPRLFEFGGDLYYCSSVFAEKSDHTGGNHIQKLALAKLETPMKFATAASIIAVPDRDFERNLMEGPYAVYTEDGKTLCLIYCANYTSSEDYCTGLLKFRGGDIFASENWEKLPEPIGFRDHNYEIFSPGATLFVPMPDGSTYAVYHAKLHAQNRYNRSVFIQPVRYKNGLPYLGTPPALDTVMEYTVNPMPIAERIFGFDNFAYEKVEGDMNQDGKVTVLDALTLLRAVMESRPIAGGDMNGDGKASLLDIARILRKITK